MLAHVIEYRANRMNRELGDVWTGIRPKSDVSVIEANYGFRHGWFYDGMTDRNYQNDGGRNIVWCDQPVMD